MAAKGASVRTRTRHAGTTTVAALLALALTGGTAARAVTSAAPPAEDDAGGLVLGDVTVAPSSFRAGASAQLRFSLSEAANVAATVERRAAGVRAGRRCVAARDGGRGRRRCTRFVAVGAFGGSAPAGAGAFALPSSGLRAGRYVVTVLATEAAGDRSVRATAAFRVSPAASRDGAPAKR